MNRFFRSKKKLISKVANWRLSYITVEKKIITDEINVFFVAVTCEQSLKPHFRPNMCHYTQQPIHPIILLLTKRLSSIQLQDIYDDNNNN